MMGLKNLFLILISFVLIILISFEIIIIPKTKFINHYIRNKNDLSLISTSIENLGQDFGNKSYDFIIKNLLNIESIRLWGKPSVRSNPEKTKLLFADCVKYMTLYKINNSNFCGSNSGLDFDSLIFVFNRVNDFNQRNAIRKTWAQNLNREESKTRFLFVLGSSDSQSIQNKVLVEDFKYKDLIEWQFIDSYLNSSLKAIGILRWTLFNCINVRFIMKTDDDILINPSMFSQFISYISNSKKTIYGLLAKGYKPLRETKSKWFISYKSYSHPKYPDFAVGPYILSRDSIYPIYKEVLNSLPALAFEDVYITGIIAEILNIRRINTNYFVRLDWLNIKINQIDSKLFDSKILFSHDFAKNDLIFVWNKLNKTIQEIN